MEDRKFDCIVHKNNECFNDIRVELSRALGIPDNLSIRLVQAVCTCSRKDDNIQNYSSINLEMYCIYEAPTDVFLLNILKCDDENGETVSNTALEFVSGAIMKMRGEQNKSAIRFICILKMALTQEYPLLEECEATVEFTSPEDLKSRDIHLEAQDLRDFGSEFKDVEEKGKNDENLKQKPGGKTCIDTSLKCEFDHESKDSLVKNRDNGAKTVPENHGTLSSRIDTIYPTSDYDNSYFEDVYTSIKNVEGKKETLISMKTDGPGCDNLDTETRDVISGNMSTANDWHGYDPTDSFEEGLTSKDDEEKQPCLKKTEDEGSASGECLTKADGISLVRLSIGKKKGGIPIFRMNWGPCEFEENEATLRDYTLMERQRGKSSKISSKGGWKRKELKTYQVVLQFRNDYCCRVWNLRKGTRSICMKYRPCFVERVFNRSDNLRIGVDLKHDELLLRLRCRPGSIKDVAREMTLKAMSFYATRSHFTDSSTDLSLPGNVVSDPQLLQELRREDYANKAFEKSRCKKRKTVIVPEKKTLYKCYNCHAECENSDIMFGEESNKKVDPSCRSLECQHHPGYIQRDKNWSCCGRPIVCDDIEARARDHHPGNGCSWGAHSWRRCWPSNKENINRRVYHEVKMALPRLYYKKKLYYTG